MSYLRTRNGSDALALEACAGLALGCAYSSSDDYEAELILMRRKAGAYGAPYRRQAYVAFALAATAIIVAVFFVI
jgi:hypothetical protein